MPSYQLLRAEIALDGDIGNTVVRGRSDPFTFPELLLFQFIHGESSIRDLHVIGMTDMSNDDMHTRLEVLYPEKYRREVFPGARPRYPVGDESIPICALPIFVAPPTRPDNPDPKLKPLTAFAPMPGQVVQPGPVWNEKLPAGAPTSEPTPDQMASHDQDDDDDPGLDQEILGMGRPSPDVADPLPIRRRTK